MKTADLKHVTLNIYYSARDIYGNCYWAFTVFDHVTQKTVSGTGAAESNIRSMEFALRDRWPVTGEPRWCVNVIELPKRKFRELTKGWPYAGCRGEELLAFVRASLAAKVAA